MPESDLSATELESFLSEFRAYHQMWLRRDMWTSEVTEEAEQLRQRLLLQENRIKRVVGPVTFSQLGVSQSAWICLGRPSVTFPLVASSAFSFLEDELVRKLGALRAAEAESASPQDRASTRRSMYEVTNPAFWAAKMIKEGAVQAGRLRRWGIDHGLWSSVAKTVYFLAAVATIVGVVIANS